MTLASRAIRPVVTELVLSELSGAGGVLILMIGLTLLRVKQVKTGNFLPALLLVLIATMLEPPIASLL